MVKFKNDGEFNPPPISYWGQNVNRISNLIIF